MRNNCKFCSLSPSLLFTDLCLLPLSCPHCLLYQGQVVTFCGACHSHGVCAHLHPHPHCQKILPHKWCLCHWPGLFTTKKDNCYSLKGCLCPLRFNTTRISLYLASNQKKKTLLKNLQLTWDSFIRIVFFFLFTIIFGKSVFRYFWKEHRLKLYDNMFFEKAK